MAILLISSGGDALGHPRPRSLTWRPPVAFPGGSVGGLLVWWAGLAVPPAVSFWVQFSEAARWAGILEEGVGAG